MADTDRAATPRKETLLYCVPILASLLTSEMLWPAKSPLLLMIVIKWLWRTRKLRKRTLQILVMQWSVSMFPKGCSQL